MPFRLEIMNSYVTSYLSLDNNSLFQGDVIEILWSIIHSKWVKSMTMAGMEPRNVVYEELVEHLEKLELSLLDDIKKKSKASFDGGKSRSPKRTNSQEKRLELV